jgi:hypothetical protein
MAGATGIGHRMTRTTWIVCTISPFLLVIAHIHPGAWAHRRGGERRDQSSEVLPSTHTFITRSRASTVTRLRLL